MGLPRGEFWAAEVTDDQPGTSEGRGGARRPSDTAPGSTTGAAPPRHCPRPPRYPRTATRAMNDILLSSPGGQLKCSGTRKTLRCFCLFGFLRRLRCSVFQPSPLCPQSQMDVLFKNLTYTKKMLLKKKICILLRLLSISYTADIGIMRFFFVITWWALDS